MGAELTIHYDSEGVILMIDKCRPYSGQEAGSVDDLVVGRMNADTGEIENLEILLFDRRLEREGKIRLPIDATLRAVEHGRDDPGLPGTGLTIKYYGDADILTLSKCPSCQHQETEEMDDSVIAGMNPYTGEIEYLEILFFKTSMERDGKVVLPISATLRPVGSTASAN